MTARTTTRLPWALLALDLVLVSAYLTLVWQIGRAPGVDVYLPALVGIPAFIAFVAVGALILTRYPGHRFGWLLCLTGLLWQFFALVDAYNTYSYGLRGGRLPGSELALSISNWLVFPGLILIVAVIPLLFSQPTPAARPLARRLLGGDGRYGQHDARVSAGAHPS